MLADKITLHDLALFHSSEDQSLFHLLDCTTTVGGKHWFHHLLANPYSDIDKIKQTQQTIQLIIANKDKWPSIITNGTIMVIQKFFESSITSIPKHPGDIGGFFYKIFQSSDYSLIQFSVKQFVNFFTGLNQLIHHFDLQSNPPIFQQLLNKAKQLTLPDIVQQIMQWPLDKTLSPVDNINYGHYLLYHYKEETHQLIDIYSKFDAYFGMSMATLRFKLSMPDIMPSDQPFVQAKNLYHLFLNRAVAYDVELNQAGNFIFLTGANMAGKSTFIKAVGVAIYLAHTGMGVPADRLTCSMFDGLLSNIQVEDNIIKGESYFYNEVQRIKKTIEQINDGRKWLILIDELFKGTNVQDAMKCSTAVIEGLCKMKNALFILSTHLYEIGEGLKQYPNIRFYYFETDIQNGQLNFSYQLKKGISSDRLGYLILKREGVVDMLERL